MRSRTYWWIGGLELERVNNLGKEDAEYKEIWSHSTLTHERLEVLNDVDGDAQIDGVCADPLDSGVGAVTLRSRREREKTVLSTVQMDKTVHLTW